MFQSRSAGASMVVLAVSVGLLYVFRSALWPFTLALVIAVLIDALSRKIAKIIPGAGRWMVFSATAVIVGVSVVGAMFIMIDGAAQMLAQVPELSSKISFILDDISFPSSDRLNLQNLFSTIDVGGIFGRILSGAQGAASGLSLTIIYLLFLILSRRMIEKRILLVISSLRSSRVGGVLERTISGIESYMYIQAITGAMLAAVSVVVMMSVGMDNAIFWALALFLLSFIPVAGVAVGSVAPALFALMQFDSPVPALIVFGVIQIAAAIIGNFVLPKMQADTQNIDPAISILALALWSTLWGIPGAFLAIPLTLALMYALAQSTRLRWIAVLMSNDGDPAPP